MTRTSSRARVAGGLLLASCLLPASLAAQVVQSERATVSQTVDGTVRSTCPGRAITCWWSRSGWRTAARHRAWLLPLGADFHRLGELGNGAVFDIEVDITLEAVRGSGGEVLGFDMRWVDDSLLAEIRRR